MKNEPVEHRSYNVNGTTQCAVIIPGEHHMQFKLGSYELISDLAGSALHLWEQDDIESMVTAPVTGTTLAVDQNGAEYNAGDLICIIPFGWCAPNSDAIQINRTVNLPPPFVGVPQWATVAAGSTASAINVTSAVTVNAYDRVYHMSELVTIRAVGAGAVIWPTAGQPKSWWTTSMGKTTLLLLNGTAACSIPYLVVEKYIDSGNWLG